MIEKSQNIELFDKNGVIRIRLGIYDTDNCPFLALHDEAGLEKLVLSVGPDGNGGLSFRQANGHPIMSLGVSSELGAGMSVLDFDSDIVFELHIGKGGGMIRLETKNGVFTWPPKPTDAA
jgi:hypothetical protein